MDLIKKASGAGNAPLNAPLIPAYSYYGRNDDHREPVSQRAMVLVETHALSAGLLLADALIAATALEHNLAILTGNAKHFTPVEGLKIVRFEP